MSADKPYRSGWSYAGEGLAWFLIWMGFGGCVYLSNHNGPLVSLKDNTVVEVKSK